MKSPVKAGGIENLKIPVLADYTKSVSREYGVLNEAGGFPFRATFVIDPDGVVQCQYVNSGPVGRNVDEVLRLLAAYQHNKQSGEVCPVNWKKGQASIDTKKPQQFFENK